MRSMIWPSSAGLRAGAGDNAPMPPVLGPVSPSPRRLKSWAVASGSTFLPSTKAKKLASSPSRKSSMTISRPACPKRHSTRAASTARHAVSRSEAIVTPLPAARPSTLTTIGAPRSAMKALAATGSRKRRCAAVGMPASAQSCFMKLLEASIVGRCSGRTKCGNTLGFERVDEPENERRLWSYDHKINSLAPAKTDQPRDVAGTDRYAFSFLGDPSVAGRAIQPIDKRRRCNRPGESMLASAGTHDQHPHYLSPLSLGRRANDEPTASLLSPSSAIIWR